MNRTNFSNARLQNSMPPWSALARYASGLSVSERFSLFMYDTGRGTTDKSSAPIILIHGLGDEADSWRHLIPLLADRHRVVAPDLPGFGRSVVKKKATLACHVAAITAILEQIGPAILVGSSMGAAVAELTAFRMPEKVPGLVLLDGGLPSAGKLNAGMLASLVPGIGERGYRAYRQDHEAAYRSLVPYYADLARLPEEDRAFLRERVIARVESETQLRAYFSSFRSFIRTAIFTGPACRRKFTSFPGSVFIGWGEKDSVMPKATALLLSATRRDAKYVTFAGAGHLPHQETPEVVAAELETFFLSCKIS